MRTTSLAMRAWLVILEVFQAIVGVWALFAPTSFYAIFDMPLLPWAEIVMGVQLVSLVILGFVVARAVNVFT